MPNRVNAALFDLLRSPSGSPPAAPTMLRESL